MTTTDPTLRSVLDAHWWNLDAEACLCEWEPDHPSDSRDYDDWADHREQAVQTFLDAARDQRIAALEEAAEQALDRMQTAWNRLGEVPQDLEGAATSLYFGIDELEKFLAAAPPEAAE